MKWLAIRQKRENFVEAHHANQKFFSATSIETNFVLMSGEVKSTLVAFLVHFKAATIFKIYPLRSVARDHNVEPTAYSAPRCGALQGPCFCCCKDSPNAASPAF